MKERISFYILMTFSFIGLLTTLLVFHEYTHMFQFKDLDKINDNLCALNLPTIDNYKNYDAVGTYEMNFKGQEEAYKNLDKNTELKATLVSFLPILIFMYCWSIVFYRRITNE